MTTSILYTGIVSVSQIQGQGSGGVTFTGVMDADFTYCNQLVGGATGQGICYRDAADLLHWAFDDAGVHLTVEGSGTVTTRHAGLTRSSVLVGGTNYSKLKLYSGTATPNVPVEVSVNNPLNVLNTTASVNTTSGALVVSGGGAFAGTVNVGINVGATGTVTGDHILQTGSWWEDLKLMPEWVTGSAVSADNWKPGTGYKIWTLAYDNNKDGFFCAQMPHSWLEGTPVSFHIHYLAGTASSNQYIGWTVYYKAVNISPQSNSTWPSAPGDYSSVLYPITGANKTRAVATHYVDVLPDISMTGYTSSCMFMGRLFRPNGDSYVGIAYVFQVDIHYKVGRLGGTLS